MDCRLAFAGGLAHFQERYEPSRATPLEPMKNFVLLLILSLVALPARAADMSRLIRDTQQMEQTANGLTFVWWIPTEFWTETLQSSPQVSEAQRAQFVAVLEDYTIFAEVVADVGPIGGITPRSRAAIAPNTVFRIGNDVMPLLGDEAITADARNFISIMKPMLANMLGQFGRGTEFLIYSNRKNGEKILSAVGEQKFSYTIFGRLFTWRLPIGSLLPPRMDAKTGEIFPGDYHFSPYTGNKLILGGSR